jgi:hypothetical protein
VVSFWWVWKKHPESYPRQGVAFTCQRQTLDASDQNCNGLIMMIFEESCRNSLRPEVTVSRQRWTIDTSNQDWKGPFLMIFEEKSPKVPQTGSDRVLSTMNDRPV